MDILDRIVKLLGDREQQELTDHLGLKKTAFSDWKGGKSKSYSKYLIEIADFFNVSIDYLVYGKNSISELTDDEQKIIQDYRELSEQGQDYIMQQFFVAKEIYKKEQSVHQSVEQIG